MTHDLAPLPANAPTLGGRYALVAKLAQGGMAGVYRGWDLQESTWVAVKILLPEHARQKTIRERFQTEAAVMSHLEHPHLVRVHTIGEEAGVPYLVMDLAAGGTLESWLSEHGMMPPRLAVKVILQATQGVHHAHQQGVIHRDIKPDNLLLDEDGNCKVSDFGVAQIGASAGLTRTGSALGTVGYMAPEQRADAKQADHRCDVYAFGAVLYRLVTGKHLTDMFLLEHDDALSELLPEPLRPIVISATAHNRDKRPETLQIFRERLQAIQGDLPDNPHLTPPLAHHLTEDSLDRQLTAEDFPEIAILFAPDTNMVTKEMEVLMRSARPVSHELPQSSHSYESEGSYDQVDYLDPSELTETSIPALVPDAKLKGTPPAMPGRVEPERTIPWAAATAAGAVAVLLLLLLGALGLGAYQVSSAARETERTHARVLELMESSSTLHESLTSDRAMQDDLRAAAAAVTAAPISDTEALGAYLELLLQVAPDADQTKSLSSSQLQALQTSGEELERAKQLWLMRAASPLGSTACKLGMAARPVD